MWELRACAFSKNTQKRSENCYSGKKLTETNNLETVYYINYFTALLLTFKLFEIEKYFK